jgi:hypothetical protein
LVSNRLLAIKFRQIKIKIRLVKAEFPICWPGFLIVILQHKNQIMQFQNTRSYQELDA